MFKRWYLFISKSKFFILFKVLFFLSVLFLIDFLVGNLLAHYYFKQQSGWLYRTTYAIRDTRADLLIFGASRANHHYYTSMIEERIGKSTYNTGRDGNAIFYHYAVLQSILKRYTPKIAILDISHGEFQQNKDSYDRISSLLPYYNSHPEIKPIVKLKSNNEQLKLISKIYPYNSLLFQIIAGNTKSNRTRKSRNDINGYVPLSHVWNGDIVYEDKFRNYEIDTLKVHYFKLFVEDCVKSGIQLFIVMSPYYVKFSGNDQSLDIVSNIAKSNKIPFYDFSNDSTFLSTPDIYADESHLNDSGARLYTAEVINKLFHYDGLTKVYVKK